MHLPRSHDGSLTSRTETLGDHRQEEEGEDTCRAVQDHLWEEVAGEEAAEGEVVEEEAEEHFHYQDMHLPNLRKNSWETHLPSLQEIEPRSTHSSHSGSYTVV